MKLVVIEGIGKKETVEKYLGPGYKVFATKGHVVDLPQKSLAVNVKKNFEPKYVVMDDKKDTVKSLIDAASKAEDVLLLLGELGHIPQEVEARIKNEKNPDILSGWLGAAAKAGSMGQFRERCGL